MKKILILFIAILFYSTQSQAATTTCALTASMCRTCCKGGTCSPTGGRAGDGGTCYRCSIPGLCPAGGTGVQFDDIMGESFDVPDPTVPQEMCFPITDLTVGARCNASSITPPTGCATVECVGNSCYKCSSCLPGYESDGHAGCKKSAATCPTNCNCNSSGTCISCKSSDYKFENGRCIRKTVDTCPAEASENRSDVSEHCALVKTCSTGGSDFIAKDFTIGALDSEKPTLNTFTKEINDGRSTTKYYCEKCEDNYILDSTGHCIPKLTPAPLCITGNYLDDDGSCKSCESKYGAGCKTCNKTGCKSCSALYDKTDLGNGYISCTFKKPFKISICPTDKTISATDQITGCKKVSEHCNGLCKAVVEYPEIKLMTEVEFKETNGVLAPKVIENLSATQLAVVKPIQLEGVSLREIQKIDIKEAKTLSCNSGYYCEECLANYTLNNGTCEPKTITPITCVEPLNGRCTYCNKGTCTVACNAGYVWDAFRKECTPFYCDDTFDKGSAKCSYNKSKDATHKQTVGTSRGLSDNKTTTGSSATSFKDKLDPEAFERVNDESVSGKLIDTGRIDNNTVITPSKPVITPVKPVDPNVKPVVNSGTSLSGKLNNTGISVISK